MRDLTIVSNAKDTQMENHLNEVKAYAITSKVISMQFLLYFWDSTTKKQNYRISIATYTSTSWKILPP